MNPIRFHCTRVIPASANVISAEIANVANWSQFSGYGLLPGIHQAEYEIRTADMVGSRIRVHNTDGSGHVEEIVRWVPGQEVVMKLHEFTPPLSLLASHFSEEWTFTATQQGTEVKRSFQLHSVRPATRPLLWMISLLFRRAIAQHLKRMASVS